MKELLISVLEQFCPDNVYLQGTLNPDEEYPATFITFFVTDSNFDEFYDNDSNRIDYYISVIYYSSNPAEVHDVPPQIIRALKDEGFIPVTAGIDIISDVQTHTGWAVDFIYPEYKKSSPSPSPIPFVFYSVTINEGSGTSLAVRDSHGNLLQSGARVLGGSVLTINVSGHSSVTFYDTTIASTDDNAITTDVTVTKNITITSRYII